MFERFKHKKNVQVIEPDVTPKHIVPDDIREECIRLGKNEGKAVLLAWLKTLLPSQLMDYKIEERSKWPDHFRDYADEAYWDVEWKIDWPYGKQMDNSIQDLILETIPIYYERPKDKNGREQDLDLNKLVNQVEGIQDKIDKLMTLISNAEFKLCGKDAMKL